MRYRGQLSREFANGEPAAVGWANLLRMDWDQGLGGRDVRGKRGRIWTARGFDSALCPVSFPQASAGVAPTPGLQRMMTSSPSGPRKRRRSGL